MLYFSPCMWNKSEILLNDKINSDFQCTKLKLDPVEPRIICRFSLSIISINSGNFFANLSFSCRRSISLRPPPNVHLLTNMPAWVVTRWPAKSACRKWLVSRHLLYMTASFLKTGRPCLFIQYCQHGSTAVSVCFLSFFEGIERVVAIDAAHHR